MNLINHHEPSIPFTKSPNYPTQIPDISHESQTYLIIPEQKLWISQSDSSHFIPKQTMNSTSFSAAKPLVQEVAAKPTAGPEPKLLRRRMLTFLRELREVRWENRRTSVEDGEKWSPMGFLYFLLFFFVGWDGSKPGKTKDSSRFVILEGMTGDAHPSLAILVWRKGYPGFWPYL